MPFESPLVQKITSVDANNEETSRDSTEEAGSADDVLAGLRDSTRSLCYDFISEDECYFFMI